MSGDTQLQQRTPRLSQPDSARGKPAERPQSHHGDTASHMTDESDFDWEGFPAEGEAKMPTRYHPTYQFTAPTVGHVPPRFTGCCDQQQRERAAFHLENVLRLVFSWGTLMTIALAEVSTFLCLRYGGDVNVHPNLFLTVLVFPLSFSINATYQRRERALDDLAIFKSSSIAWFFLHQEWAGKLVDPKLVDFPENKLKRHAAKLREHNLAYGKWHLQHTYDTLQLLFREIRVYLSTTDTAYPVNFEETDVRRRQVSGRNDMLRRISEAFKEISFANERLRMASLAAAQTKLGYFPVQAPILTRPIHWTFFMLQAWEKLRGIREYRSPTTIRSFTKVLTYTMPSMLAPYFAFIGVNNGHWAAYFACAFAAIVLSSLRLIQDYGENPFIPVGRRDIDNLNLGELDIDWNPSIQVPQTGVPPPSLDIDPFSPDVKPD